jgi:hypothetical protein
MHKVMINTENKKLEKVTVKPNVLIVLMWIID